MKIENTNTTMITNDNTNYSTDTQDYTCTKGKRPIIFELPMIAGLFFKDDAINELLKEGWISIKNIQANDDNSAYISIELSLAACDYYELTFKIASFSGDESFRIYDEVVNLDSYHLKKWMHIALCDEVRKTDLIQNLAENYSFQPYMRILL